MQRAVASYVASRADKNAAITLGKLGPGRRQYKRRTTMGYTDAIGKVARHLHVMLDPDDRWFGTCAVDA